MVCSKFTASAIANVSKRCSRVNARRLVMPEHGVLFDTMIYLAAAVLCVPLAKRTGLGSVLGYLAAGCVIGPFGLRLVHDVEAIMHFAEFGVVLMLFVIGL